MKKIITIIIILSVITLTSGAQRIDTVTVASLQLRAQDWAWLVGKYGQGGDSTARAKIRAMRDAIRAANPGTWTTNVTLTNIPGNIVLWMYNAFVTAPFSEVMEMGSNNAERTTIYTNIRAISNSALQYYIGAIDANLSNEYLNNRKRGKEILIDN